MSRIEKTLFAFAIVMLLFVAAPSAEAQIACDECDPQTSYCEETCWYCRFLSPDGYCAQTNVRYSTCGVRGGYGCLNCDPTWSETSRDYRGSYGNGDFHWTYWECTHHVVELVTMTDTSACNENPAYRTYTYCDDTIDHSESGSSYQDCCDGGWYCDGNHSC
jgi:hypothetical protein